VERWLGGDRLRYWTGLRLLDHLQELRERVVEGLSLEFPDEKGLGVEGLLEFGCVAIIQTVEVELHDLADQFLIGRLLGHG